MRLAPRSMVDSTSIRLATRSQPEHSHRTDRRRRTAAPLHWQADEGESALAKQRFQIAQALDVGDVEVEAGFVNQRVASLD